MSQGQSLALGAAWLRPMALADVQAVLALEQRTHSFAWTRGNLLDSLAAGHLAWVLEMPGPHTCEPAQCVGYYIAMLGVEEMHLLNITVAPEYQGQGLAQRMLVHLGGLSRAAQASMLWLEVRQSNAKALRLYERFGFEAVGLRKGYYPAAHGLREHATVMRWPVPMGAAYGLE